MSKIEKVKIHILFPHLMCDFPSLLSESVQGDLTWILAKKEEANILIFNGVQSPATTRVLSQFQQENPAKEVYFPQGGFDRAHFFEFLKERGI